VSELKIRRRKRNQTLTPKTSTSVLCYNEFFRVSHCTITEEMWGTLRVTHERTSEVKRARMNTLMHENELFIMIPNETIHDLQM
jgi:hypothetical protein